VCVCTLRRIAVTVTREHNVEGRLKSDQKSFDTDFPHPQAE